MAPDTEGPSGPKRRSPITIVLIAIGIGALAFCILFSAILFPVFAQARNAALSVSCQRNMKRISEAIHLYAADNDGYLPRPSQWEDQLSKYHRWGGAGIGCPSVGRVNGERVGYAFNSSETGKRLSDLKGTSILVFDSTLRRHNAFSGLETMPAMPRHIRAGQRGNTVLYADGSVGLFSR
jgi:hypothetical protein